MRVLFLDVDGVLNNDGVFSDRRFGPAPLDHLCVGLLHDVVRQTGCQIVLSSSWREMEPLEAKLAGDGVFSVYLNKTPLAIVGNALERVECRHPDGSTKRLWGQRGDEIAEWLSRHPEVSSYAIVDDDSDMLPEQMPRFVQTNFDEGGLTEAHADRLIGLLAQEPLP